MPALIARDHAVSVRRLAAVGQVVNAAESLAAADLYGPRGVLRGQARATSAGTGRLTGRVDDLLDSRAAALTLHVVSLAAALATLAGARDRRVRTTTAIVSAASAALSSRRNPFGRDGSDQMQQVIALYDAVSALVPDPERADELFLRAVNAQLVLSYFASGLIKLVSDDWRSGRAVALVMRTSMYGSPAMTRVLDRYPLLGRLISWQTIAWETAYPLLALAPGPVSGVALRFAKLFHVSIGHFMGLPRFIWAFSAAHPAARFVARGRWGAAA